MNYHFTVGSAIATAAILSFSVSADVHSKPNRTLKAPQPIEVGTQNISFDQVNPLATTFGRLKWRGGLILSSSARQFGGYSGLAITENGRRLIAVSDKGTWLTADLLHKRGQLTGLKNTVIGPLLARNGKSLRRKKFSDAEEISLWKRNGRTYALISFERNHRIGRFPITSAGIQKPSSYLKLPKALFRTTRNKGLEAVTVLTDKKNMGTVLTFAERLHDKKGFHKGWLIYGKRSSPIRLKQRDGFDITGLATLENGNVLVLERSFSIFSGVRMRIREIKHGHIKPKARLDGTVLITASMRYNIDNMEGISTHRNKKGETIISLISDDNFNRTGLQKTILLQFALD